MDIRTISWQDALPIRHQVLWPNKPASFCKIDDDETATHYGAYVDDILVSVASIYIEGRVARLRKFATLFDSQNKGIGSRLISHLIKQLKASDVDYFWCDARTSALGFYEKFGLQKYGDEFDKSGITYYKMKIEFT